MTNTCCGSLAATEEDTMNLVNSRDVVADRIRGIQAQAAGSGGARRVHGTGRRRGAARLRAARSGLATWAGTLARPQQTIKTVEEL